MVRISETLLRKQSKGKEFKNVKKISLRKLCIEKIENLECLEMIQVLDLAENKITEIVGFYHLK